MDWLERMNVALDYIEDHLADTIDYDRLSVLTLCPGNLFQRMFAVMTQMPLSEYVRRRRLSSAGMDLASGTEKVIDVALRYGYDSADAFAAAFKRLHGVSPSQAKRPGVTLTHCPRLSFTLKLKGEKDMKYKIVERQAFKVVGKNLRTTQEQNMKEGSIPKFWGKCNTDGTVAGLCRLEPDKPLLGVCHGDAPDGSFSYLVGLETARPADGYDTLAIPAATWAVFPSVGPMPDAIQKVWHEIFTAFLPASKYDHAPIPDFELYPEGDPAGPDYYCEVWIPIVAKR